MLKRRTNVLIARSFFYFLNYIAGFFGFCPRTWEEALKSYKFATCNDKNG